MSSSHVDIKASMMIPVLLRKLLVCTCLLVVGFLPTLQATHIIGGEMNYACLGNNEYEISLTVYRDCYLGEALMDDTAYVAVYDQLGILVQTVPMLLGVIDTVTQPEDCYIVPPNICIETTIYKDTITLLPKIGGYHISYQRCCRNATILNIIDPLNTGATYEVLITEVALLACNTSPKIKAWPPTFVCVDRPLVFDHSAFDQDGDSLVYSLCTPFEGGISLINPRPRPAYPPPYRRVRWNSPTYDLNNVLGGIPLTIDAATGLLEGTPNTVGQFVVGICVEEFRNGQLISITNRDFQYNVIPCQEITASFSLPTTQCNDVAISPIYQGPGTTNLYWKFFKDQTLIHTSTEIQPQVQSLDTGQYVVRLIVSANGNCVDSLEQSIELIENDVQAEFDYHFSGCQEDLTLTLFNGADTSSFFTQWTIQGDSNYFTSLDRSPKFEVAYEPNLTIQMEVFNSAGCKKKVLQSIAVPQLEEAFEAGFTWEVDNCQPGSFDLKIIDQSRVSENANWLWSLSNGLQSDEQHPVFRIDTKEELVLQLTLSDKENPLCESIYTSIIPGQYLATDITFSEDISICGVTTPVELYAYGNNIARQWWLNPEGDTLSYAAEIPVTIENSSVYIAELQDELGCIHQRAVAVAYQALDITFDSTLQLCIGALDTLIVNSTEAEALTFSWIKNDQVLNEISNELIVQPDQTTNYHFEAHNELGCSKDGTINVEVIQELPTVEIAPIQNAIVIGNSIELNATAHPNYQYLWEPAELLDNPTIANPMAFPEQNTLFTVIVSDENGCTAEAAQEIQVSNATCERPFIFLPNAFTPNGDGENDVLFVRGQIIKDLQLIIYDRWGDQIFETNNLTIGWDGTKNGTPQPSGVFGYYLYAGCYGEMEFYEQGNITLIR